MNIVIVESVAKVKIISSILNNSKDIQHIGKFYVIASCGHIRDLRHNHLGIDIDDQWRPLYELKSDKKQIVADIKKLAFNKTVWIATDCDREGEAIAMHLLAILNLKKYHRIIFNEITSSAIIKAILNPTIINQDIVNAQETRRILDRLVGFKISPILWNNFNIKGLSAGRVQSAVLAMICDKDKKIEAFKDNSSVWQIHTNLHLSEKAIANLYNIDGNLFKSSDKLKVKTLINTCRLGSDRSIVLSEQYYVQDKPDPPFITSTLLQCASTKLKFSNEKTMKLAQELYEAGMITYMRTDSYNISKTFVDVARNYIFNKYGEEYFGLRNPNTEYHNIKNAQEAHEAIRITSVNNQDKLSKLDKDAIKLYNIIEIRTYAALMNPCISNILKITIRDDSIGNYMFIATLSRIKFSGYRILYNDKKHKDYKFRDFNPCNVIYYKIFTTQIWKTPEPYFTNSTLIKNLEKNEIGRPSTYANILQKLFEKKYVSTNNIIGRSVNSINYEKNFSNSEFREKKTKNTVGGQKGCICPTVLGNSINDFMMKHFSYICNKKFTAILEKNLDLIALNIKSKCDVMNAFWDQLKNDINDETINNCFNINGNKYKVREAKYGPVIEQIGIDSTNDCKKFIGLEAFMNITGLALSRINKKHVMFLTCLPIRDIHNQSMIAYGKYGFYRIFDDKSTKKIQNEEVRDMIKSFPPTHLLKHNN